MFKKVFIDANIFLDISDKSRNNFEISLEVLKYLISQRFKIYTSCDLITTIYYILSKKSKLVALDSIEMINEICTIISFSNKESLEAVNLMKKDKDYADLEDTLQYILAKRAECDLIITNDKNFVSKDILLLSTKDFLYRYIQDSF